MRFDSGEIELYRGDISGGDGGFPSVSYTLLAQEAYSELKVGITRHYMAKEHDEQVALLVRIHQRHDIAVEDTAVLYPYAYEDGAVYRVVQVQHGIEDSIAYTDIALERREGLDADAVKGSTDDADTED